MFFLLFAFCGGEAGQLSLCCMTTVVTTNAINHHILASVLIVLFYLINKLFSRILLLNSGNFPPCRYHMPTIILPIYIQN